MKKVEVRGRIVSDDHIEVYQWLGYDATSPKLIKNAIAEAEASGEKELLVEINSGGGSVFAGAEIHYALKKFNGTVNVEIPSLAASAASFIAMAGDKVSMSIVGQMMIHGASTYAGGNHKTMNDTGDFLRNVDDSIINAYLTKTSKTREELRAMMNQDTWMTAQQALDAGFIDEILFENTQPDAVANVKNDNNDLLPPDVIDKIKAEILASKVNSIPDPMNVIDSSNEPPQNNIKEEPAMDLQTLQNEHPELFNQVKQLGYEEGQKAENARIAEIDELATPGNESLVSAAKQDFNQTAATLAVAMIKAEKAKGANFLENRQKDAETVNTVPATQEDPIENASNDAKLVAELSNYWGGTK